MNDLISRKALLVEYDRVHIGPPGNARKLIEDAPAVDAVPVVRCKDCKHMRVHKRCCTCLKRLGTLPDDLMSYCSAGEKG